MNDNEIIKALECCKLCSSPEDCYECPYGEGNTKRGCVGDLINDSLEFINRQQAEIERLEVELKAMRGAANSYKAENGRLKRTPKCVYAYDGETMEYCVEGPCSAEKTIETLKSEARKEFAERLIKRFRNYPFDVYAKNFMNCEIGNLLEEMEKEV